MNDPVEMPPPRPLWQELALVVAPVLAAELCGWLRDRWRADRDLDVPRLGASGGVGEPGGPVG